MLEHLLATHLSTSRTVRASAFTGRRPGLPDCRIWRCDTSWSATRRALFRVHTDTTFHGYRLQPRLSVALEAMASEYAASQRPSST